MANKGKFVNTTHTENINTLVEGTKRIINNPYYVWANRQPTVVTYFNLNTEMSTLDEGFKGNISDRGKDSSLWYNKISNFFIYGLEQIQVGMEHGEFGAEAGEITGEGVILPNTIIPYANDYFKIDYLEEQLMFRIIDVSHDTLENGSNLYKITYKLESDYDHEKDLNVKEVFEMITNNVGTSFNAVIHSSKVDLIEKLEDFLYNLKVYYTDTFYNERVQSFIFKFREFRMYDPYMTRFLIDNKILVGGEEYIYLTQHIPLKSYFNVEYGRTFFSCLEKRDFKNVRRYHTKAICRYIDGIDTTIFGTRLEDYHAIDFKYYEEEISLYHQIPCFTDDLIRHIETGELFMENDSIFNIIIKFAHNRDISADDVDIMDFDVFNNIQLFYTIPCIIFCIEAYIKRMMVDNKQSTLTETSK